MTIRGNFGRHLKTVFGKLGDWLPTFGKGKTADLLVSQTVEVKDKSAPCKAYRRVRAYSTVGEGNGFIEDTCNWYEGVVYGSYEAPLEGEYARTNIVDIACWNWESGVSGTNGSQKQDHNTYMILRYSQTQKSHVSKRLHVYGDSDMPKDE